LGKSDSLQQRYSLVDQVILSIFSPLLKISSLFLAGINKAWDNYIFLVRTKEENKRLKEAIERLRFENQLLKEAFYENKRLRALVGFPLRFKNLSFVVARIIGRDPSCWFSTVLIDKGLNQGVSVGSGVITLGGVVGRVIEVGAFFSKVLLITDPNSYIEGLIQPSRTRAMVRGNGKGGCVLEYVPMQEDIKEGELVVTSGTNGFFPKGINIGKVIKTIKKERGLFQWIEVMPSVNFSKIEEVLVIKRPVFQGQQKQ